MSHTNLLPVPPNGFDAHTRPKSPLEGDPCASIRDAPADQPFVVAQLGQSLDGRIAAPSGESRWINHPEALDHVHRLRATVDAVVVGIGTVLADDPLLSVRRVPGRSPARVVIDPTGRLPARARCLSDDGVPRFVVRATDAPAPNGVEIVRLRCEPSKLDPKAIVSALFNLGLKRLLIEGGAHTVSRFIDAEAVDRLHLLVGPMILGCGKIGIELSPIVKLSEARRPRMRVHLLEGGDVLFDCDLRGCDRGL